MTAALCARPEWQPEWWDLGHPENAHAAEVCRLCPRRAECVAEAVEHRLSGVLGGELLVRGLPATRERLVSWAKWGATR